MGKDNYIGAGLGPKLPAAPEPATLAQASEAAAFASWLSP